MDTTTEPQPSLLERLDSVAESIGQEIRTALAKRKGEEEPCPHINQLMQDFSFYRGYAALERMATGGRERYVLETLAEGGTLDDLSAVGLSEDDICDVVGGSLAAIDFGIAVIRGMSLPKQAACPSRPLRRTRRSHSRRNH